MEELSNINVSNLGLTNIFEIKDSINKKFESRGLPHRLYTEVFESIYDEDTDTYLSPYVKIYINLKVDGYSYYRLETFNLTSNMCQLYNESDVMKMVMKKLKLNVNPIKKTVKKVEEVHQNILQKTLKIFSSVNPFYYISTVIKS